MIIPILTTSCIHLSLERPGGMTSAVGRGAPSVPVFVFYPRLVNYACNPWETQRLIVGWRGKPAPSPVHLRSSSRPSFPPAPRSAGSPMRSNDITGIASVLSVLSWNFLPIWFLDLDGFFPKTVALQYLKSWTNWLLLAQTTNTFGNAWMC